MPPPPEYEGFGALVGLGAVGQVGALLALCVKGKMIRKRRVSGASAAVGEGGSTRAFLLLYFPRG
jgi:hypothetical protein